MRRWEGLREPMLSQTLPSRGSASAGMRVSSRGRAIGVVAECDELLLHIRPPSKRSTR